jgi:hypothetical protein
VQQDNKPLQNCGGWKEGIIVNDKDWDVGDIVVTTVDMVNC